MTRSTHPRRKSPRLPNYDYSSNGAYFVTTCTQNRESVLCKIEQNTVQHSTLGTIVQTAWLDLPNHYPNIELDAFIIMPDHIHGIIWLHDMPDVGDGLTPDVGDGLTPDVGDGLTPDVGDGLTPDVGDGFKPSPTKHGLTEIVRALKTFSARRINEARGTQGTAFWQRGFYDHIVRVEHDLENIRAYILENPLRSSLKGIA
jgi:REP element-mobilizing transposase RayT